MSKAFNPMLKRVGNIYKHNENGLLIGEGVRWFSDRDAEVRSDFVIHHSILRHCNEKTPKTAPDFMRSQTNQSKRFFVVHCIGEEKFFDSKKLSEKIQKKN